MSTKIVKLKISKYERIGWFREKTLLDWNDEWEKILNKNFITEKINYYQNIDKTMLRFFKRYLPKNQKIMEAGCGYGLWVYILKKYNYDIYGIDSSLTSIQASKLISSNLDIREGDILDLKVKNESLAAYISLGVVEHTQAGPEMYLREAKRVLKKNGLLMCSVPYYNLYRKFRIKSEKIQNENYDFYQWAFSKKEFKEILEREGFKVKVIIPYSTWEPSFMKNKPIFLRRVVNFFAFSRINREFFGHMVMFIAYKK